MDRVERSRFVAARTSGANLVGAAWQRCWAFIGSFDRWGFGLAGCVDSRGFGSEGHVGRWGFGLTEARSEGNFGCADRGSGDSRSCSRIAFGCRSRRTASVGLAKASLRACRRWKAPWFVEATVFDETAAETGLGGSPARDSRPANGVSRHRVSEAGSQLDSTAEYAARRGAHGGGLLIRAHQVRTALGNLGSSQVEPETHWRSCRSWKLVVKTRFHSITFVCVGAVYGPEPGRFTALRYERGSCVPQRKRSVRRFENRAVQRVLVSRCRLQKSVQRIFPTGGARRKASDPRG